MVLAVAAALLIGFAASTLAYRYRLLRVPGEPIVMRMQRELHLTPAQLSQIRDIMADTRLKTGQYYQNFRRQSRLAFLDALRQIRATLTPEQQEKFDSEFLPRSGVGESPREGPPPSPEGPPPPPRPGPPQGGL